MIIRTRIVEMTEYVSHCEVCGVRIVVALPGPQMVERTRMIGSQVALCPDCADKAQIASVYTFEEEYLEALNGTQHTQA